MCFGGPQIQKPKAAPVAPPAPEPVAETATSGLRIRTRARAGSRPTLTTPASSLQIPTGN